MTQDELLIYGMLKDERLNHLRTLEALRQAQKRIEDLEKIEIEDDHISEPILSNT